MADWLRNILYLASLFTMVACLWAFAEAESLEQRIISEGLRPAAPELVEQIWGPHPHKVTIYPSIDGNGRS